MGPDAPRERGPGPLHILYGRAQAFNGPIQKLLTMTPRLIFCQFFILLSKLLSPNVFCDWNLKIVFALCSQGSAPCRCRRLSLRRSPYSIIRWGVGSPPHFPSLPVDAFPASRFWAPLVPRPNRRQSSGQMGASDSSDHVMWYRWPI